MSDAHPKFNSPMTYDSNGRLFEAPAKRPPRTRTAFVRDLTDGQAVAEVFLVTARSLREKRNGERYMTLTLRDRTGTLPAVCWEGGEALHELTEPGAVVRAMGRFERHERWGAQLTVQSLTAVEPAEYSLAELIEAPAEDVDEMERDLRRLIETVQNRFLRHLLAELLGPASETWRRFHAAPAAKHYHQAYRHGLLEHTLSVGQAVHAICNCFPGIDHDLAVTGALIHDIGKIEAYAQDPTAIDLTDLGRLHGEIPLGYYLIRSTIERIDGFPPELARGVLHILLSHHGTYENGSPVTPCTREATAVHAIDNLGGKLGSFDRLERGLADGETWSQYDRALAGSAWFPPGSPDRAIAPAVEELPAASGE
jgi:3'-5' exoribonuclease